MKVLVRITADQIARGFVRSVRGCPAALAIVEATGGLKMSCAVGIENAMFDDIIEPVTIGGVPVRGSKTIFVPLPKEIQEWIAAFDRCDMAGFKQPEPVSFEVEIPDKFINPKRICPKCGQYLLDLSKSGFAANEVGKDGYCYQWADEMFTCVHS